MIPLSVLDLSPIVQGGTLALAFRHTLELAQHAERLGYKRFWLAEHHNMPGIGSAATAVLIVTDPTLNLYWNRLDKRYNNESCFDLSSGNPQNLGAKGCPAHGVTSVPPAGCKAPATTGTDAFGRPACICADLP